LKDIGAYHDVQKVMANRTVRPGKGKWRNRRFFFGPEVSLRIATDFGGRGMVDDMGTTLARLEAHWGVVDAELTEIARDINHCEACARKYGDCFQPPLTHLRQLRADKKAVLRGILRALETFNHHVEETHSLLQQLDRRTYVASVSRVEAPKDALFTPHRVLAPTPVAADRAPYVTPPRTFHTPML